MFTFAATKLQKTMSEIWEIIKIVYEPCDSILQTAFVWILKTLFFLGFFRWFYLLIKDALDDRSHLPWYGWF